VLTENTQHLAVEIPHAHAARISCAQHYKLLAKEEILFQSVHWSLPADKTRDARGAG